MPRDVCAIPPGREWAVRNCLAEVPGSLWDAYLATGLFPAGMQRNLEETSACHVNIDVYVKRGPARVPARGVNIPGFFPWGWYRVIESAPDDAPPDPAQTTAFEHAVEVAQHVPTSPRAPLASGTWGPMPVNPCVTPVPTVDLWIPFPFKSMNAVSLDGALVNVPAGGYGRLCWRVPGSDHPLFATGLGVEFIVPGELSELGARYAAQRARQGAPLFGSAVVALFDVVWAGTGWNSPNECIPYWFTRDYAASHMQCLTPLRYGPGVPVTWRWREGGAAPKPYQGAGFDVFEIRMAGGLNWVSSWPALRRYAVDDAGTLLERKAPEFPFGMGVAPQFNGPAPGTFA